MLCIRWSLALLLAVNGKMGQQSEEELVVGPMIKLLAPLLSPASGLQVQPVTHGSKMSRFNAQPAHVLADVDGAAPLLQQRSQVPASPFRRCRPLSRGARLSTCRH